MAVHPRKKITMSILIPFLFFILFFSIMIWQKYRSSREVPVTSTQQGTEGRRSVILFFAADGIKLAREARETGACADDNACLKSVLNELVNGPIGEYEETLPEGTAVVAARIDGSLAVIEFNRTFSEAMLPGSSSEMLAVFSVVNTITVNFPQVQQVKIDIDGNKGAILHHLDLSDPLLPDYSLEQSSLPASENNSAGSITKDKGIDR